MIPILDIESDDLAALYTKEEKSDRYSMNQPAFPTHIQTFLNLIPKSDNL